MEKKILTDTLSVSAQITPDDVANLAADGITAIICNRPDYEDPGQIEHQTIAQAAADANIDFYFMPVVSGGVTPADGDQFAEILQNSKGPVHAYCRSGTRCTTLWALAANKAGMEPVDIVKTAANAGYDLSRMFAG